MLITQPDCTRIVVATVHLYIHPLYMTNAPQEIYNVCIWQLEEKKLCHGFLNSNGDLAPQGIAVADAVHRPNSYICTEKTGVLNWHQKVCSTDVSSFSTLHMC